MNEKKNILVVTGTRAEYGILRSTMDAVAAHPDLALKLLVTGMHTLNKFGKTEDLIRQDGYTIDCEVPILETDTMLEALAQELRGIGEYLNKNKIDCVVVLGDRDEALAGALAALHTNVPIAHIHGGDATGPGVDETIRQMITKAAHLHFPATAKSAARIRALGEEAWRVEVIGTPGLDRLGPEFRLSREETAKQLVLDAGRPWLMVVMHPTAFDSAPLDTQINETLAALKEFPDHEKILSYPNSDTGAEIFITALQGLKGDRYHVLQSLPRDAYISVISGSDALIGNSSSGIIEAAFLGAPTVNIGNRQGERERGESVINVPYDAALITNAIRKAIDMKKLKKGEAFPSPYGQGEAGRKIAEEIAAKLQDPRLLSKQIPIL
jgi:GDP/UDP-N,N'-diacetylbacillosamine 2-epimerase (hydrolysing)